MEPIARLQARASIEDSLARYARAIDRRDWPALRECYHADATDEHGEFSGGLDEFIDWVSTRHADVPSSTHFLGNCLVEFVDDSTALVETYFIAIQRKKATNGSGGEVDSDIIGRYVDRFECRDGLWKVAKRVVVYDGSRIVPSSYKPRTAKGTLGQRDSSDPVFTWKHRERAPR
jgi:3-phenylpropionate/cinnamic acid dioxygenase small subunit